MFPDNNTKYIMKKIVVTGGAGFLGSNLCARLLELECSVICIDNFYTGRRENIQALLKNSNFKLLERNIIEPISIDGHIDGIFNLACPASPPHYQKDPIYTTKTSVLGAINMLELALEKNAKILQSSTSEVYGDPLVHPQTEEYRGNVNPIGIRSCYDEGKRCAESLFFDYWRNKGVKIKVARIFNTYGPFMDPLDGRVVSNFIIQALKGGDITIYGKGEQTRSFCYVDDLISGLIKLMDSGDEITGPINIGNPNEFTMRELADKVLKKIGSKSKTVFASLPSDDPLKRKPDISLARDILDWEPKVMLDEGLDKTIQYFKGIL
jgi:UDP-glucuronate decarboxylase